LDPLTRQIWVVYCQTKECGGPQSTQSPVEFSATTFEQTRPPLPLWVAEDHKELRSRLEILLKYAGKPEAVAFAAHAHKLWDTLIEHKLVVNSKANPSQLKSTKEKDWTESDMLDAIKLFLGIAHSLNVISACRRLQTFNSSDGQPKAPVLSLS
jgi:hypothetical protein